MPLIWSSYQFAGAMKAAELPEMRMTIAYQVSFLWFQIRCNRLCKKLYKVAPSPCLNVRFWLWLWNLIRYAEILVFFSDRTIAVTSPVSLQLLLKSPFFRFNLWNLVHIRIRFHGFNKRVSAVTFCLHLFQPSDFTLLLLYHRRTIPIIVNPIFF